MACHGMLPHSDAALVKFELPLRNGVAASATYTFSKAIDVGTDFTSTTANQGPDELPEPVAIRLAN